MSDSDSVFSYGQGPPVDYEVEYYNTYHVYPAIGHILYTLPTGPPQPQMVTTKQVILPGANEFCTTNTFSYWMEWKGTVPMELDHAKAVVCLTERKTKLVDSPFERGPFELVKVQSEHRTMTPRGDFAEYKLVYVENEELPRNHYNYSVYEGAPIYLPYRYNSLDSLEGHMKKVREGSSTDKLLAECEQLQEILTLCERLLG